MKKRLATANNLTLPLLILMLAFVLRIAALDGPALRGDEAFSLYAWAGPLDRVFGSMTATEPHPPLTYIVFSGWVTLTGQTELGLRYLSVLASMVTVAALYGTGQQFGKRQLALAAGLLAATNPFQIWHAQDARNYALWAALSGVALWLMLTATNERKRSAWLLYVIVRIAALYTFYLDVFILAIDNLYALLTRRLTRRWVAAQAAIGLALLGLFAYFLTFLQDGGYHATAQTFAPVKLLTWFLPTFSVGDTLPAAAVGLLWPVLLIMLIAGCGFLWQSNRRAAILVVLLVLVPPVLLSIISMRMAAFRPRYILASAPGYIIALAAFVLGVARYRRRLALAVLTGLLLLNGAALMHHYTDPAFRKSPDWRGLVAFLDAHAGPDDLFIQNEPDPTLDYYYKRPHATIPIEATESQADIAAQLDAALASHRALWFVPAVNPAWDADMAALHHLEANAQAISDDWVGNFRVQQWRAWEVRPAELDALPLRADFSIGGFVRVPGCDVYPPLAADGVLRVPRGGRVTLLLYWTPSAAAPRDYAAFVHLIGPANPATGSPLWAQSDHPPQSGRAATSTWTPGLTLRDVFTLDLAGVPPGDYVVQFGLYDPATAERVDIAGTPDDAVKLFEVVVLPD